MELLIGKANTTRHSTITDLQAKMNQRYLNRRQARERSSAFSLAEQEYHARSPQIQSPSMRSCAGADHMLDLSSMRSASRVEQLTPKKLGNQDPQRELFYYNGGVSHAKANSVVRPSTRTRKVSPICNQRMSSSMTDNLLESSIALENSIVLEANYDGQNTTDQDLKNSGVSTATKDRGGRRSQSATRGGSKLQPRNLQQGSKLKHLNLESTIVNALEGKLEHLQENLSTKPVKEINSTFSNSSQHAQVRLRASRPTSAIDGRQVSKASRSYNMARAAKKISTRESAAAEKNRQWEAMMSLMPKRVKITTKRRGQAEHIERAQRLSISTEHRPQRPVRNQAPSVESTKVSIQTLRMSTRLNRQSATRSPSSQRSPGRQQVRSVGHSMYSARNPTKTTEKSVAMNAQHQDMQRSKLLEYNIAVHFQRKTELRRPKLERLSQQEVDKYLGVYEKFKAIKRKSTLKQ